MKLSTRTRYGIRAILDIAESNAGRPMQIRLIAKNQEISVKYLEQIMALLKSAGIVRSIRGSKGGYLLAKPLEQLKLSDIFHCLEGSVATVECIENEDYCERAEDCIARELWEQVQKAVDKVLESVTVKDLLEKARDKKALNYHI